MQVILTPDAYRHDTSVGVARVVSRHPRDCDVINHGCTKIHCLIDGQRPDAGVVSDVWCHDDSTIALLGDKLVLVDPERQALRAVEVPDRWRCVGGIAA